MFASEYCAYYSYSVWKQPTSSVPTRRFDIRTLALILLSTLGLAYHLALFNTQSRNPFEHLASHCAHAKPISSAAFVERQAALARVLRQERIGAYVTEPGPSATYFANISLAEWKLSERVFLVVVRPGEGEEARVSVLAPEFERDRAGLLAIPAKQPVEFIGWAEEESPYEVLGRALGSGVGRIVADEGLRLFVYEGLKRRVDASMAPSGVRALRERKGPEELALMRCANEVSWGDLCGQELMRQVTLMAIRAVRERMYIGIRESEVKEMMLRALSTARLEKGFALVQFGGRWTGQVLAVM